MVNRFQGRSGGRLACGTQPPVDHGGNCAYLRRLQAIDFALADLILYLNAYPSSAEALAYFYQLKEERRQLMSSAPEGTFPSVTALDQQTPNRWSWIQGPWPWEPDANC